jgi:molecular chaperone GrpE
MAKKKPGAQTKPLEEPAPEVVETPAETPSETVISPEMAALIADLAETQTKRDEYLDGWQRAIAEFSNYKKRVERDREMNQQNQTGSIVKRYLEIADDLERALKTRPLEGDGAAWANGVDLIYRKLGNIFDSQGIKPMSALGQPFDPNQHEAIGHVDSTDIPSGHVAEVVQTGYCIGERVLRPALVRIAS